MATAQAQQQSTVSYTDSLELVRCLLRVSVFHISYLRGLFPDDFFKGLNMKNLDGMNIKLLQPFDEESKRLIDWVEEGVYDAIKLGYLKTLFFGVATDKDGSNLLEEYIFNFAYNDGRVTMDVQQKTKGGTKGALNTADANEADMNALKYQVIRLMRMLVQICQTLDKVPQERYLFMKLMYHDTAPESYDPPYFKSLPVDKGIGHFSRKPFSMNVGSVNTKYHNVSMKVKSTLDCCEEGDTEAGSEQNVVASAQHQGQQPHATDMDQGDENNSTSRAHEDSDITMPDPADNQECSSHAAARIKLSEQQYAAVKSYVVGCFESFSQVEMVDAMGFFLDEPPALINAAFVRMQHEGILVPDRHKQDAFRPAAQKAPKSATDSAERMMANLAMQDGSQRAEIGNTGSDMTGNGSPQPPRQQKQGKEVPKPVYLDTDLQSGAQQGSLGKRGRARGGSFVEEPIYQGSKRAKRTPTGAASPSPTVAAAAGRRRK